MSRQHPEDDLQRTVCEYLELSSALHGFEWHAVPNGGKRSIITAAIMKGLGVKPGVGDICIMWKPGKVGFIELKVKTAQSPAQVKFQESCRRLEIPYSVCRSLEDVESALIEWGVIKVRALA